MRRPAGPPPTAYRRAILRLARRDHSVAELRRALLERGHTSAEVEEALDRLRRERYLDDSSYAERFARSRLAHQHVGRLRIRQALRERGVPRAVAEAGIRSGVAEAEEREVLESLARRYWRQHAGVPPERRLGRVWTYLLRRGFAPALVQGRLHALWPRWSDALSGLEPLDQEEARGAEGDER